MTVDNSPEDMDAIVAVTLPRDEYLLFRKFMRNLNAANMVVRWAAVTIGALAVVMGIAYSLVEIVAARAGNGHPG